MATAYKLEEHRAALTGHCYRMLGSAAEADDAVQETMVRAWRSLDRCEERASPRTWLYRIATRVCLDSLSDSSRRARPMEMGPVGAVDDTLTYPPPTGSSPSPTCAPSPRTPLPPSSWCCARASASRSWPRSSTSLPGSAGLLHQDATLSMPPFSLWLRGHEPISQWLLGRSSGCRGSRLVPTSACGSPAFGQYRPPAEPGGPHKAWALIVLELSGDRIAR